MAKKKTKDPLTVPIVDTYQGKINALEEKISTLDKENAGLKIDLSAKITEIENLKRDNERRQRQAAKLTKHNPWTLIHQSADGKDRTEIIKCGSMGTVIMRVVEGVPAIVFAERVRHRFNEHSGGLIENSFT